MAKRKQPKRIRVWANVHDGGVNDDYSTAWPNRKTALACGSRARRVAVPLVELRRGEVVVNVEELVEMFVKLDYERHDIFVSVVLRAALKKVGVR